MISDTNSSVPRPWGIAGGSADSGFVPKSESYDVSVLSPERSTAKFMSNKMVYFRTIVKKVSDVVT